jgi:hypothetical protein
MIGVRQPTISRYASGKIPPSAAVMARIRDASRGAVTDWMREQKPRRRAAPAALSTVGGLATFEQQSAPERSK